MPHLTLEYTENVSQEIRPSELLPELYELLAREAGIDIGNCKSRAICRDEYHIGRGETRQAFVHLEIRVLEGRPPEVKRAIGKRSLAVLDEHLGQSAAELNVQLTVEIVDMQRAGYFKVQRDSAVGKGGT